MDTRTMSGFIFLMFEEGDWSDGGAQAVIQGIKREMGHCAGDNPDGWTYDPDVTAWSFKDTPRNREIVAELKRLHLDREAA